MFLSSMYGRIKIAWYEIYLAPVQTVFQQTHLDSDTNKQKGKHMNNNTLMFMSLM